MGNVPSPKIYIASPFGFSEAGRAFLYNELEPLVREAGFEPVDPWKLTPSNELATVQNMPYGVEKRDKWRAINMTIGKNNADAIRTAHGLFAILDGSDIDSGTASEIGFAAALGKPILGYRSDFRLSSDNEGALVNLQVEYFIHLHGGKIVSRKEQVAQALKEVVSPSFLSS